MRYIGRRRIRVINSIAIFSLLHACTPGFYSSYPAPSEMMNQPVASLQAAYGSTFDPLPYKFDGWCSLRNSFDRTEIRSLDKCDNPTEQLRSGSFTMISYFLGNVNYVARPATVTTRIIGNTAYSTVNEGGATTIDSRCSASFLVLSSRVVAIRMSGEGCY